MKIGYLKYVVRNCKAALQELCRVNEELNEGMNSSSGVDVNKMINLDRMIKDYIIVRVAGLFDFDTRTVSFSTVFPGEQRVSRINQEEIVSRIIEARNRFVAHSDFIFLTTGDYIIHTNDICSSNLMDLLDELEEIALTNLV